MDLLSRIDAQNAEMDRIAAGRSTQQSNVAIHMSSLARQEAALHRQLSKATATMPALTEESLLAQERELDRQLRAERARQGGGFNTMPRKQGPPTINGKENAARASIPLLPPGGRAPPTASVAGSVAASERRRRPVHFTHAMVKEVGTSQMDDFMKPVNGIRDQMRRAGVEPKNHQREQRERISELAQQRQQKAEGDAQAQADRQRKEQMLRDRSRALHQAQQQSGHHELAEMEGPSSRGASAGRRSGRAAEAQPARYHEAGAVPAYLQRRKAQWAAEEAAEAERAAAEAACPPGLRLVGAEEKERILQTLAEEKAKATLELQSLPFVIKTKATQQRKDRLEERLEQIDKATGEYLKERVFVPLE